MRCLLASLLFWWGLCLTVLAQEWPQDNMPLMGSEASSRAEAGTASATEAMDPDANIFRILVAGDSLAGGLGAGMTRMSENDSGVEILNRFNESSGLARSEVYDWPSAISKIAATKRLDAIVVLLGLNDRQAIRDGDVRHAFREPEWERLYKANIDRLLDAAQAAKAKVYWISMPPMADATLDADMRYISDLQRARVAEKGGHFVDVRPFFTAPDGSFVDRVPDVTGLQRKLRARDGVNFFKQGNNRFAQLVLGAIKSLDAAPSPADNPPLTDEAVKQAIAAAAPPSFGQAGIDGEDITFRADAIRPLAPKPVSVAQRRPLAPEGTPLRIVAKPGSASEKLLVNGDIPTPPPGRFDDFSVPPLE